MYCVLLVSCVLMAADRYLFPMLAVDVRRDFGFSLANTGLLATIFTLGLGLGGLPTGYLLARFPAKTCCLRELRFFRHQRLLLPFQGDFGSALLLGCARHRHGNPRDVHICARRKRFCALLYRRHWFRECLLWHLRIRRSHFRHGAPPPIIGPGILR